MKGVPHDVLMERVAARREYVKMVGNKESIKQLAERFGVNKRAIERDRKALKMIKPPARPFTDEEKAEVERLIAEGYYAHEIAHRLGRRGSVVTRKFPHVPRLTLSEVGKRGATVRWAEYRVR